MQPTPAAYLAIAVLTAMPEACIPSGNRTLTPLIDAARAGDIAELKTLLAVGADPNRRAGVNGWTPLLHAVHKNQESSVRVLLKNGARLNDRGNGGETPLILAAGYGYERIVRLLLDSGADPYLRARNGGDALSAAVGGAADVDRFTIGRCQTSTVQILLSAAPDLRVRIDPMSLRVARFAGCRDVVRLITAAQ